jgi:hypothetical protein
MDLTLQIALVAAVSAVVGGLIPGIVAPHVAWGIEKRKQKLVYRRELISKWRAMLQEIAQEKGDNASTRLRLERHRDFYSFLPHLRSGDAALINEHIVNKFSPEISPLITHLVDEVERIEREWDLA